MLKIMEEIISQLKQISAGAQDSFGRLSAGQINWKPSGESWSVGQCFEHLIKTNEMFYDQLERIADGTRRNSFLENYSPLSGFFGRFLIKSLKSDEKKFKAPSPKIVPPSEIDPHIIEIFAGHQTEFIGKINDAKSADLKKIVITSPFLKFMTYKFTQAMTAMVEHEKRHIRQAERVRQTEGFPAD
ncbi:MAG: DinB family protein [Pyrinomonadaceae bacterium]